MVYAGRLDAVPALDFFFCLLFFLRYFRCYYSSLSSRLDEVGESSEGPITEYQE